MIHEARRVFRGATAFAVVCLLSSALAAGQAASPQAPQTDPPMAEDVFTSVALLRDIPVDTFFETMGMFAAAMGNDCTFCHSSDAYFDAEAFAIPTPRIMRARQMIVMMNTINETYFAGESRVTCFTCHGGNSTPGEEPELALQYGPPTENPNARDFAVDPRVSADQVFDRYLEAIGGTEQLAQISNFSATGIYSGFDTAFAEVPVEIFANSPDQSAMIVHQFNGNSVRTYDGSGGWMAGPDTPVPLLTLTGGNLRRARLQALLSFPTGIRDAFSQWRVGRTAIEAREVRVVQGSNGDQALVNLFFDEAGLMVRMVSWTETPAGLVPTQVDYADYREVSGIKMPFRWTVTQTYMQMTVALNEMRLNVEIDPTTFDQPTPSAALAP